MTDKMQLFVIMFADVCGSTRLYEKLGDTQAQNIIQSCLDKMAAVVRRHHGVVIKTIGDEIMCRFNSPDDGVDAACDIQEIIESGTQLEHPVSVRIGIHYGPALEKDGDVFGDAVNIAARMAGIAKAAQVITTDETVHSLSLVNREKTRIFDRAHVKGKQTALEIYEVLWETHDVTRIASAISVPRPPTGSGEAWLNIRYQDENIRIPSDRAPFVIGRGSQCDLVVDSSLASRTHARIEYRRGKFILIDQSTNGTFVQTKEGKSVYLRREEIPLLELGKISLGEEVTANLSHLVIFQEHTCR